MPELAICTGSGIGGMKYPAGVKDFSIFLTEDATD
jgi:hypothetical protein